MNQLLWLSSLLVATSVALPLVALASEIKGPDVLVVADAKTTAASARIPTAEQPIYYYFLGGKERVIGHPVAGEKMPTNAEMEAQVTKILAAQYYVRTEVGGPKPDIFLMVVWGAANAAIDDIPDDDGGVFFNKREMSQLLGVGKANRHNNADPFENDQIRESMQTSRVYVMIGAFDADAMAHKQKKLVWRISMSVDSAHESLPTSLATMLASAAPYIGHDTDRAYQVGEKARRNGKVDIGPLKVIHVEAQPVVPATKPSP